MNEDDRCCSKSVKVNEPQKNCKTISGGGETRGLQNCCRGEDASELPEGQTAITLQRGNRSRVVIPVTNGRNRDITLILRAGRLRRVTAVCPVDGDH